MDTSTEDDCAHCGDAICGALRGFEDVGLRVIECESDVREDSNGVEAVFAFVTLNDPADDTWPPDSVDRMREVIIDAAHNSGCELPVYITLHVEEPAPVAV